MRLPVRSFMCIWVHVSVSLRAYNKYLFSPIVANETGANIHNFGQDGLRRIGIVRVWSCHRDSALLLQSVQDTWTYSHW